MKQSKVIFLSFVIVIMLSPAVFAMGGPAQEEEGQPAPNISATAEVKPAVTTAVTTNEAVSAEVTPSMELQKARTELSSLEARREKVDKYLDVLSKKIMMAKVAGNAKKVSELQATERQVSGEEKKILYEITIIKNKYPDIQPATGSEQAEQPKISGSGIVYHDVEMGDTLVSISKKYYGSPDYYMEIAKLNNIKNIGYVAQGTRLKIDLSLKKSEMPAPAAAAATPQESAIVYHVVAAGDTLMSISRKYFDGSASYYKDIAEMNGLTDYNLKIGMRLKIDKSFKKPTQPKL